MTKENIMIFTIVMAVTIGAVFCWCYYGNKVTSHKTTSPTTIETGEAEEMETIIDDRIDFIPYESASYLTVEKVIRTQVEREDGTVETQYDSYLLSDIDLKNGTDETTDYSNASVGDGFEIGNGRTTDFISEFGFDYKQMSGAEVYEQLLDKIGITRDFDAAVFDQDTYEKTGQKTYVLDQGCDVTDKLIKGVDYDELISSKVFYQITGSKEDSRIPDYFVAITQYKVDGQLVTKNLFLQVTINPEMEVPDESKE
ncbi:hypothetical protein [Parasporobacterium paucivorans]|uniref:Uncharacterized protein n=1 Tax=Parasporobacterium paucivorans DSM 15970 TaxID=1122934 RepID=A0A1M6KT85_9FIRM|nr:hypothetical protein [Parasporobacterium paucivorans]SHJ62161.1 hypothetical protein SAMN02745691_02260 [Parasporobacterium paucivorans DSM 15970]